MYTFKSLILALVTIALLALVPNVQALESDASQFNPVFIPQHIDNKPCCASGYPCADELKYLAHDCSSGTVAIVKHVKHGLHISAAENHPVIVPPIFTDNTPSNDPTNKDKKNKHCNNGEGNGPEGCSPAKSSRANNDENGTTPKEDKSKNVLSVLSSVLFVTLKRGRKSIDIANVKTITHHDKKIVIIFENPQDENGRKLFMSKTDMRIANVHQQTMQFDNNANRNELEEYFI